MWYYFMARVAYHFTRWFPKDRRCGIRLFLICISLLFLIPQFIVLVDSTTGRYCDQHLLNLLVTSIGMTFAMIGFTFLFTAMEPVPWKLVSISLVSFQCWLVWFSLELQLIQVIVIKQHQSCICCHCHLSYFHLLQHCSLFCLHRFGLLNFFGQEQFLTEKKEEVFVMSQSNAAHVYGRFKVVLLEILQVCSVLLFL